MSLADQPCNPVTTPVTQMVPGTVTNPAPHHTTPHHTTKNTSSRGMALGPQRLEALATIILSLRPDWLPMAIYDAIKADDRPWRTVVAASIRGALLDGPDTIRHPNGLRYVNPTTGVATPQLPTVDEALNPPLCPDHGSALPCPLCRRNP